MKAQTEHTPGPWQALNGGPYVTTKVDPEGEYVICVTANTVNQVGFAAKVASLEDQANARLIAAAPEMLEALEKIYNSPYSTCSCAEIAKAAIAKAKGTT